MFLLQKSKKEMSSRRQVDIHGVESDILILPNHRYRKILRVSSVNFELKSDVEQDALIDTYQSFLNSLGFPLQILIRTREIDFDQLINNIDKKLDEEKEEVYKSQIMGYQNFIHSLIKNNKILTRNFFVIIPFNGTAKTEFESVQEKLNLSTEIVAKGLSRLGIHSHQLTSLETLDLFYSFYSPNQAKIQPLSLQALSIMNSSLNVQAEVCHA